MAQFLEHDKWDDDFRGRATLDRRTIIGGLGLCVAAGTPFHTGKATSATPSLPYTICHSNVQPAFFWAEFWSQFVAGLAAGWLIEVLKNYGFVPGAQAAVAPEVVQKHSSVQNSLSGEGYQTGQLYSGDFSRGDVAVGWGARPNDLIAFSTNNHGHPGTCPLLHYAPDICALHGVTTVLRKRATPLAT